MPFAKELITGILKKYLTNFGLRLKKKRLRGFRETF